MTLFCAKGQQWAYTQSYRPVVLIWDPCTVVLMKELIGNCFFNGIPKRGIDISFVR
jgi:hypothetical protein